MLRSLAFPAQTGYPRSLRLASAVALVLVSGCYSYAPVPPGEIRPGRELRARFNDQGTDWIESRTGDEQPAVQGRVVRATADTLVLAVWRSDLPNRVRFEVSHDTLRVPSAYVSMIEGRRISYLKTGALVGAAAVGLYLLVDGLGGGRSGEPGGDGGPLYLRAGIHVP